MMWQRQRNIPSQASLLLRKDDNMLRIDAVKLPVEEEAPKKKKASKGK